MDSESKQINGDDLSDLPDIKSFIDALADVRRSLSPFASVAEIAQTFYDRAIMHTQLYGFSNPPNFTSQTFYRARLNIDLANEDIGLIKTYSYPPSSACKVNGRANLKGRSVFYCSDHALTAIYECKPKVGDYGFLSIWDNHKADRIVKFAICLPKDLRPDNNWTRDAVKAHLYAEEYSRVRGGIKSAQLNALNEYISRQFIEEKEPYLLTSMLAENYLYYKSKADFIVYPSIVANSQHCNLAFHPNSVETLLSFKKVIRFRVTDVVDSPRGLNLAIGKTGELNGACLEWRKTSEHEVPFLGTIR